MIATWNKLRALWRTPSSATSRPDTPPAPTPPVDSSNAGNVDALRAELARLESAFADANARTVEVAGQVRQLNDPAARSMLETLKQEIEVLRRANEAVAARVSQVAEQFNTLAAKVDDEAAELTAVEAKTRTLEERTTDAATAAKEARLAAESAQATFRAFRQDMEARDQRRDREMNGRLAGLYIIGFISLTAALATLVIYLMQGRSQ